jgi:hypothetical protein
MEVKMESLKTYGVKNPEFKKSRVKNMKGREKEGLEMARRNRDE